MNIINYRENVMKNCAVWIAVLVLCLTGFGGVNAQTISAPGAAVVAVSASSLLGKDLISAAEISDQAVLVGALPKDDPLPVCLHDALQKLGLETPPGGAAAPQSFEAKPSGAVSAGVIIYLQIQRLKTLSAGNGLQIDPACYSIIGRVMVDGLRDANRAALPLGLRILGL
jgi:hypothetical protein